MSKTTQKALPYVTIANNQKSKDDVTVEIRLQLSKATIGMLHELAKIDPMGDAETLIYILAKRGFNDQLTRKLEGTRMLGHHYAEYLRKKYSTDTSQG